MILAGGARVADLLEREVPFRRVVRREVRQPGELGVALGAQRVLTVAQLPATDRESREPLAFLGRRRPLAATTRPVLLGLELLELGSHSAPRLVDFEHALDAGSGVWAAPRERRADGVGVATDQLDVENARPLRACAGRRGGCSVGARGHFFFLVVPPAVAVVAVVLAPPVPLDAVVAVWIDGGIVPIGC